MTVLIITIAIVGLFIFMTYNKLVQLRTMVEEAFSTMDVCLKKRWDLIPNLVETVKGYATFEQEALENVIRARSTPYSKLTADQKLDMGEKMTKDIGALIALGESYPNLKANENFSMLASQLVNVEDEIAKSRKYFNGCVRYYNTKVQQFPNNLIADTFGFTAWKMFEAELDERKNVKVEI